MTGRTLFATKYTRRSCITGRPFSSSSMSQLKRRAVAGSFIFKFPGNDTTQKPQVALFQRSAQVKTYQHKYAPISGSVEESDANPLATAWRELHEETTLDSTSLRLFRQGKPYLFVDESVGREWTINPFGFVLKSTEEGGKGEAGIRLDWEHEGFKWFDADDITDLESFQGVPKLLESFSRVWFDASIGKDAGAQLQQGLATLQDDHESGAHQLASTSLKIFTEVIQRLDMSSAELWWKNARFVAWHLWKNGRESMGASVLNVLLASLEAINKELPEDLSGPLDPESINRAVKNVVDYAESRRSASLAGAASFAAFVSDSFPHGRPLKILTLSSSSTVCKGLSHAIRQGSFPLDIRFLESRPLFEGVNMADKVLASAISSNASIKATVFTDANAAAAAAGIDILLIGADLIDGEGNVSNKVGSLPAVLTARYVSPKVKVIVLADREKVLPFDPPKPEENDPAEISQSWGDFARPVPPRQHGQLRVKNTYFEWVPSKLIDHFVFQDGVIDTKGVSNCAEAVRKEADKFFSSI